MTSITLILSSAVSRGSPEWMDHERISNDVSSLKSEIEEDEVKLKDLQKAREEDKNKVNELKDELAQLQEMRDLALRLKENFGRFIIFFSLFSSIQIFHSHKNNLRKKISPRR